MATFNNLKGLLKHVSKQVEASLKDEVADTVRFEEQKQIENVVYDSYPYPYVYERRRFNDGGLQDIDVMVAEIQRIPDGVVLSIVNLAKGQDQEDLYLAPLVEYGHDNGHGYYQYPYNQDDTAWKFLQSRPFTAATIEALQRSKKHVKSLKEGLKKRGIKSV